MQQNRLLAAWGPFMYADQNGYLSKNSGAHPRRFRFSFSCCLPMPGGHTLLSSASLLFQVFFMQKCGLPGQQWTLSNIALWARSACVQSLLQLFATPWTSPTNLPGSSSMEFSRQEYWSRFQFPTPGDLPEPGIEPASPALAVRFSTTEAPGKPTNQPGAMTTKILGKDCLGPSELRRWNYLDHPQRQQACHCELFLCHFQRHLNDKPQPHPIYHQN